MNASSWKKAADLVAKVTPANPQLQAAAMAELQHLQSLPLSALSVDDSGPLQVTYDSQQPIAASTPRATSAETPETPTEAYHQILPAMSDHLYPTLVADDSLNTHVPDNHGTLQTQLTSEVDKYLQEVEERHKRDINYFDGRHVSMNTTTQQQNVDSVEHEEEKILELIDHETSMNGEINTEHYIQYHDELETIPEESDKESPTTTQDDVDEVDTIPYAPEESDDAYLIDNPQQHIYCMSPDSEYVSLIMYATKIEIDLCNFPAIWAVLSILLDTQSNKLQHVKNLQQVVDDYYDKRPTEVMSRLEHQTNDIMYAMYDSINNDNFDSVSDYTDRVSGAVDNDYDRDDKDNDDMPYDKDNDDMPDDNDNDQMPEKYANDYETAIAEVKYERNMTNDELKDVGTKDMVLYKRNDRMMTKVEWPIETSDIDDEFMREYDDMCKLMEYRQIHDFYEARRHIQSAMEGDTPVKTGQNRQCIDNVSDYDREHDRILNSVRHRLDIGPNMLPGAQQHTTVESAAALKIQDNIEGKYDENIYGINGQYRNEMYKRAENMVPQLDGTYNVSDDSEIDSHSYLDLASANIIAHRM